MVHQVMHYMGWMLHLHIHALNLDVLMSDDISYESPISIDTIGLQLCPLSITTFFNKLYAQFRKLLDTLACDNLPYLLSHELIV